MVQFGAELEPREEREDASSSKPASKGPSEANNAPACALRLEKLGLRLVVAAEAAARNAAAEVAREASRPLSPAHVCGACLLAGGRCRGFEAGRAEAPTAEGGGPKP